MILQRGKVDVTELLREAPQKLSQVGSETGNTASGAKKGNRMNIL